MFFILLVHLFFIISNSRSVCQTYSGFQSMAASTDRSGQKIRPGHLAVSGALKRSSFLLRQDPCKSRSYAAGGARYLQADLMLLTHAGCAFKDPRGRFGISYPAAVLRTEQSTAREVKSDRTRMANAVLQHITCMDGCVSPLRTAALRSNRRYGAAALLHCGAKVPLKRYPLQENAYLYRSTRRVRCS